MCVRCAESPAAPTRFQCEPCLAERREAVTRWNAELRAEILAAYGTSCARCGSTKNLDLHHTLGDGDYHRINISGDSRHTRGTWQDLRKRGFPPGMETLCRSCHRKHHAS